MTSSANSIQYVAKWCVRKRINHYCKVVPEKIPNIVSMIRKYRNHKPHTTAWHREEEPLNHHETPGRQIKHTISFLFPIKMIAILEWTKSNVQQNREHLQTPTMGVTINKKSTTFIMCFQDQKIKIVISNLNWDRVHR